MIFVHFVDVAFFLIRPTRIDFFFFLLNWIIFVAKRMLIQVSPFFYVLFRASATLAFFNVFANHSKSQELSYNKVIKNQSQRKNRADQSSCHVFFFRTSRENQTNLYQQNSNHKSISLKKNYFSIAFNLIFVKV